VTALIGTEIRRILARRLVRLAALLALMGIVTAGLVLSFQADETFTLTGFSDILKGTTVPLVLASWLLGASSIGAEWRAGTVTTALTWEPRRVRLLVAKAVAATILAVVLTVTVQALLVAAMLPAAFFQGTTAGADAAWFRELVGVVVRGALLAGVGGAIGFSIAAVGRNTAFALGVGFVYLAILEGNLLGGLFPGLRRWLLVGNAIVLVSGEQNAEIVGRSVVGAGLLLAVYSIGAVMIAIAFFRARDVT
jgi:hypothetical protein